MPPFINNPLPSSMRSECKKCGRILASFIDPSQAFGPDKIIPPSILANAKGLAILTVFKVGFLGSGRFGSGVVVARLSDGTWSAPSAIGTVGGGFGGQIGFEITDFIFILNDAMAVKTFAQVGSLTLGGNVSIAAGPIGRNAEAAGAASLKSVSGIFAYSKTKGLFAGVSLEGSVLIERRDANEKMYNQKLTARQLLGGEIPVPPAAEPLMRVLNTRAFAGAGGSFKDDSAMYNDVPVYDDAHEDVVWQGNRGSAMGEGVQTDRTGGMAGGAGGAYDYHDKPSRASTWQDDPYDTAASRSNRANPSQTFDRLENTRQQRSSTIGDQSGYAYSDSKGPAPGRPSAPKPAFASRASAGPGQAIAKFAFDADQPGDLGFKKGEIINIIKRTDNESDWWTGRIGTREGIFPSNYVDVV
ncbi:hypothetical protein LTR91_006812 [Friedmanniomyces endolithicus]|uniref:SH3 domain-containing protein n=1 Tax=Friedmanniomyces endolithicus TaxID=329885 RepID=A0AAN6KRC2_9PEZI|nr:hypothetical protein LTR94_013503 [Friedmanniomyces endolithicus]KAK0786707.1 hypothetical protein LTR38_011911 [Friedmanniomyces endolithicus]KAK0806478.1 hypothetical protein LTR59_003555 [Friedmanniomyces endolithicus]KAK0840568.1 hypothetical protein LTR03_010481 [Friedmanniomyces endolithicus]KAK0863644.1 hypothetical protein LTR87_016111 [Friedmanniomyces endolithicus]